MNSYGLNLEQVISENLSNLYYVATRDNSTNIQFEYNTELLSLILNNDSVEINVSGILITKINISNLNSYTKIIINEFIEEIINKFCMGRIKVDNIEDSDIEDSDIEDTDTEDYIGEVEELKTLGED